MTEGNLKVETPAEVDLRWGVRIPTRDGTHLSGTLYTPRDQNSPLPAIFTLTPYIAQTFHDWGMYFAAHGFAFLTIDVRGRGNSEGAFKPYISEGRDGHDLAEWVARQPFCNGQVATWGGSYAGYNQWAMAAQFPPHLATIVPVASPYIGLDSPMQKNIALPYSVQWLTLVSGRTSQDKIFWNNDLYWNGRFRQWFESGLPFNGLDAQFGNPSEIFQEWIAHPEQGPYWDRCNPTSEQYARLAIPILTITGSYDANQPGALMHYREHLRNATPQARTQHYLVIGPWDHAGTRSPSVECCGLKFGPESLVDLGKLHRQWYRWTMQDGPKPEFLRKNVAYYVMGAEKWRYADTLEEVTAQSVPYYLHAATNPTDVFNAGALRTERPASGEADHYVHDPLDVSLAQLESTVDWESRVDHRMVYASVGRLLVYHTPRFVKATEISGFFKLSVWLAIDQPDTDFRVSVYDVGLDGSAILLSSDWMRARYREGLRESRVIDTTEPLRYDFERFMFVSRRIDKGHCLRLVVGPLHSIYSQKNYNSGGVVSEESMRDARPVKVRLYHDPAHPSALYVPFGQADV